MAIYIVYFIAIWYVLWLFGIFLSFWYVVPRKNLATLPTNVHRYLQMANLNDFRISIQVIFRLFFGCLCERLDENIFDGFTRFSVSYVNFWRPQKGSTSRSRKRV
jgi:hypothetical protein